MLFINKKRLIGILAFCVLCVGLITGASGMVKSWYFKPSKQTGERPGFDEDVARLKKQDAYCIGKDGDKKLYLTFDAGYENGNVKKIVDILDKNNIKAAFFFVDNIIKKEPDLIRRMEAKGHLICNHTLSHRDMTKFNNIEQFGQQLTALEDLYRDTTGKEMAKYYRPPEGKYSEQNLEFAKKLGYKTIFWSLAHADWDNNKQPSPEAAIKKLISRTHDGAVILLHPTSATNAAILQNLIDKWREMGYSFGTLDELTAAD
ncbi:MAG: polysaccharide deacetylase family protein [Eubacteriales bacterium]